LNTPRIPLGRAHMLASSVMREARRAGIGAEAMTAVGSLRRYAPDIGDVSLLGVVPLARHRQVMKAFTRLPLVVDVKSESETTVVAGTERGPVTLHLTTPEQAGAALVWHTGARAHVDQLQARAVRLGFHFHAGAVSRTDGAEVICTSEDELYARLELPYIAPELRSGNGEVSAAERGQLPRLISAEHIRGDLHMHSTWSDGRNTIADMVSASRQLGYEYVAITDHSERAWSSRTLGADEVAKQREEIDALRARMRGIEILHGIEVDIMADGRLDFDDDLLAGFDIVLASLHEAGGDDQARLTERYLRAIRHPLVNVITHPANRAPGRSSGYRLDFERLFAAAVETGTAMEVDGAPGHLDMDGEIARQAAAAGVTIAIDSDCHRIDGLARQMQFGVGTARRGWVEPAHVLNTRPIEDVRAFVARKRGRG
jgi:DNA polymerase (family 10)